jgi:transcriptional regulator with XRE-family HTH domain
MQALNVECGNPGCTLRGTPSDGSVPRTTLPNDDFGLRLVAFRRAAALTQSKLGAACGMSQRMIAHYETRGALPPGHVLTKLAEALAVSVDELVGNRPPKPVSTRTQTSRRILRRLQQMEKLPLKDKRELLAIIDTYLEKNRLAKSA